MTWWKCSDNIELPGLLHSLHQVCAVSVWCSWASSPSCSPGPGMCVQARCLLRCRESLALSPHLSHLTHLQARTPVFGGNTFSASAGSSYMGFHRPTRVVPPSSHSSSTTSSSPASYPSYRHSSYLGKALVQCVHHLLSFRSTSSLHSSWCL